MLHEIEHVPVLQTGLPLPPLGPGQFVHVVPHAVGSVFDLQSAPHLWKPVLQLTEQLPELQTGLPLPLGGAGQFVQFVPQAVASVFDLHSLPHL